jgi:hypothetical protein
VGFTSYQGDFVDTKARGFLLRKGAEGPVNRIDIPGALGTGVTGINDRGQMVGRYGNNPNPSPSAARADARSAASMTGLPPAVQDPLGRTKASRPALDLGDRNEAR